LGLLLVPRAGQQRAPLHGECPDARASRGRLCRAAIFRRWWRGIARCFRSQASPALWAATESWPPNIEIAQQNLVRSALRVLEVPTSPSALLSSHFDLLSSRHPGGKGGMRDRPCPQTGRYLSVPTRRVGSNQELPELYGRAGREPWEPERARQARRQDWWWSILRQEALRNVSAKSAAVVYFPRKVLWTVPGFSVERYRATCRLHDLIERDGSFVSQAAV